MALGQNEAIFEFTKAYSLNPTDLMPNYYLAGVWQHGKAKI